MIFLTKKIKGFTTPELLLAIGVIGVISAILLPLAFRKTDDIAFGPASEKVNYTLTNTLDIMNSDRRLTGYQSTKEFVDSFIEYVKTSKRCSSEDLSKCFPENFEATGVQYSINDVKSSAFMGKTNWCSDVEGLSLKNGINMLVTYNPYCSSKRYQNCIAALYDLNSPEKMNVFKGNGVSDLGTFNAGFINGSDHCGVDEGGNEGSFDDTETGDDYDEPRIPPLPEGLPVNFEWDDNTYTKFHEAGKSVGEPSASNTFKSALISCKYPFGYDFEYDEQNVWCYAYKDGVYWAYYFDYFDGHWDISTSHTGGGGNEGDYYSQETYDKYIK